MTANALQSQLKQRKDATHARCVVCGADNSRGLGLEFTACGNGTVTAEDGGREKSGQMMRRGLCATCRNAPECTYPRDPGPAVLQCEEFDGYGPRQQSVLGKAEEKRPANGTETPASKDGEAEARGLCATCRNRDTCTFTKREGGVRYCDEYE